jgi:hypothetical protein
VALSPVIEDFGLRFGAAPLPEADPLASIEIGRWLRGTQIVNLWRPPRRPRPAAPRPRPHLGSGVIGAEPLEPGSVECVGIAIKGPNGPRIPILGT